MISGINRKEDLLKLVEGLDISPTMFKSAVEKYNNIGKLLQENDLPVDIYPQGSFAIGTVVRPYKNSKDADFDIDCICLLRNTKEHILPCKVKNSVGDLLKSNKMYQKKLLKEDNRCWTLEYAETNGIGFNLDVVPAVNAEYELIRQIISKGVSSNLAEVAICITDKDGDVYKWANSNPKGYSQWFKEINAPFLEYNRLEKRRLIFESNRGIFNSVEDIPEGIEKSSLQRVIQILKRHRDIYFSKRRKEDYKPISAIITTIVAQIAKNALFNMDTIELLEHVVKEIDIYSNLIQSNQENFSYLYKEKSIINKNNNIWTILNPSNPLDNLTDSWNDDPQKAKCFFEWVKQIKIDFIDSFMLEDNKFINILENSLGNEFVNSTIDTKKYNVMPATTILRNTPKPYRK